MGLADRTPPTAEEYAAYPQRFSNWGRWGDDDELGERDRGEQLLLQRGQRDRAEDAHDDREQGDQRAVAQAEDGEQVHGTPRFRSCGESGTGTPLCTGVQYPNGFGAYRTPAG